MKFEQIQIIELYYGRFAIVDDFVLFIDRQRNLIVMNLETKEHKDLKIGNCNDIWSFEDKFLIQI